MKRPGAAGDGSRRPGSAARQRGAKPRTRHPESPPTERGEAPSPGAIVAAAVRLREALFGRFGEEPLTNAYRLLHGAGDGAPGVSVDALAGRLILHVERPEALPLALRLEPALNGQLSPRTLLRKLRHAREERGKVPTELVHGELPPGTLEVLEEGVRFEVEPLDGLHFGLFTDLREEHTRVRRLASGRRLLNTFAYTGAFSICAALGGAAETTSVDIVARPLERARRGLSLNGLDPAQHRFARMDVLEFLRMALRKGWRYDAIILDPPTFGAFKRGTWSAERDYPRLLEGALAVLEMGGLIWAISNTGGLEPRWLERRVEEAFAASGRSARILAVGGLPPDYPTPVDGSGRYLKVLVLEADVPGLAPPVVHSPGGQRGGEDRARERRRARDGT